RRAIVSRDDGCGQGRRGGGVGPRPRKRHLSLLGPRRPPILESNQEGEMSVLMRQDDRFDSAATVFEHLSESRGRGAFPHGIAVGQPATVEHLEQLSTEGMSGPDELGRAWTDALS